MGQGAPVGGFHLGKLGFYISLSRINLPLAALMLVSLVLDVAMDGFDTVRFPIFAIPLGLTLILSIPYLWFGSKGELRRSEKFTMAMASFLWMVVLGSIPFILSGEFHPEDALLESVSGFTTTALSSAEPGTFLSVGHGLLFYRVAIQWVGGFFYLTVAFLILSEINDLARRSVERRILSRVGLAPKLYNVLYNVMLVYSTLTVMTFLVMGISGRSPFDSACIALSTVSTGGFSADGRMPVGGAMPHLLLTGFMFLSGIGYHVHMSILSSRWRRKALLDVENLVYVGIALFGSAIASLVLFLSGSPLGDSMWKGPFVAISALSTNGFTVNGIDSFPDSAKMLLLVLMLIGASSFSVASGFKIQRVLLLLSGLVGEIRRSAHPNMVTTLRRGDGFYSEKALESASVIFLYLFFVIGIGLVPFLLFGNDLFDALSLVISSVTNTGMTLGTLGTASGIHGLGVVPKMTLVLLMFLGRFEVLLPLYFINRRARSFRD